MSRALIRLRRALLVCVVVLLAQTSGCSRAFWRNQADDDVYQAVGNMISDPRWAVPRLDITPDPRSRFFDPYDPDHGPLPPDDAAAHALMHNVDGKAGYRRWHKFGDRFNLENPQWLAQFGITPDMIDPKTGAFSGHLPALQQVTLQEAVELSLIHSREYQSQLEAVYLSALDVTFERFQFGIRYLGFGGGEPSVGADYTLRPHGPQDSLGVGGRFGMSQLLPAGGQIAVELANNTLWLFGPDATRSATSLSYSLVQPLLIGAGRKIVMENLTQTERNLLYSIRDLARFRQEFFTDVVGSQGGYLGLLQRLQTIRNQEDNIRRLERQVAELREAGHRPDIPPRVPLEAFPPGVEIPELLREQLEFNALDGDLIWRGPMTGEQEEALRSLSTDAAYRTAANELIETIRVVPASLDVLQLQSQLMTARNSLRDSRRALQDALDSYKLRLGLPTDMPIGIDDSLLQQFRFIDPELRALETSVENFVIDWSRIDDDDPEYHLLLATTVRYLPLAERVQNDGLLMIDEDRDMVQANLGTRLAALPNDAERDRVRSDIGGDIRQMENARTRLATNINGAREMIQWLENNPRASLEDRKQVHNDIKRLQEDLLQTVRGLTVTQIGFRLELVQLQPFDMELEHAVALAIENRVDLMNVRARVMDARRRVEVAANRLMSRLDLVVEGDIRNGGAEKPLDFRLDQSDLRFGVQFTTPLDQVQERNAYRAAQIAYERARRDYIAAEDRVKMDVRVAWRQLDVLKSNLETSRQSVRIAALQLDSAVEEANAPVQGEVNTGGLQGQNLLRALDAVLRAQDSLLGDWISFEQNRLNIYRDMGIMEVGPDGLWADAFYQGWHHENSAPNSPDAGAVRIGPHADAAGGGRGRIDRPGFDGVVPVGRRAELDRRGEPSRLVSLAVRPGGAGTVPGEHLGTGARGQSEERDAGQPRRRLDDDHQHRPGGDVGESRRGDLRTRLFGPGR